MDVRIAELNAGRSRIGIVVPRYGHTAVDRNRVKRRLREIVRVGMIGRRTELQADIVMHALPAAYEATFAALRTELVTLCTRAGL